MADTKGFVIVSIESHKLIRKFVFYYCFSHMVDKISYLRAKDSRLAKVIDAIGDLDIHEYTDSFKFLIDEIVGQMLSANVRRVLISRLEALCNDDVNPYSISALSIEDLRGIGLSNSKSSFILNISKLVINKELDFSILPSLPDDDVVKYLMSIKGVGIWTSKMYLLFFLNREDILPVEDVAFLQAFKWLYGMKNPSRSTIERRCKKWSPFSSLASRYMYRALDTGLTKIPVSDFLSRNNV